MASQANVFSLLTGAEQTLASKKKKKANKPKQPDTNGGSEGAAAAGVPAPPASSSAVTTSSSQPALAPAAALPAANLILGVSEACAIFERAAREARSVGDKVKLWREWTRLAGDKTKSIKYADADGSTLDFKQVILRCKALEICAEGCITSGVSADKEATLAQMFGSFLPNDGGALANQLVRLSSLLSDDAPDTVGAAQRAVHSLVASLKASAAHGPAEADAANPVEGWISRVGALDKDIAHQHNLVAKLVDIASKGAVTREATDAARELVKLHGEKFDLLQPECIPAAKAPAGAAGTCLRSIEELKAVITQHLKEVDGKPGKGPSSAAQQQAALSSYQREEDILNAQAAQVAGQVRALEAQLSSLRMQQAEIEDKRAALAARQRAAWESAGGHSKAQAALTPAHYREGLALADGLQDLLDPRRSARASPEHVLAMQAAQAGTPLQYVADGEAFLGLALKALGEVPARLAYFRQRIEKAGKWAAQAGSNGKLLSETKKSAEDAERLLQETLRMAEELLAAAGQVRSDVHIRFDAMARFSPDRASQVAAHIRNIDALAAQVHQQYAAVLSGGPAVVPAMPALVPPPMAAPAPMPSSAFGKTGPSAPIAAPSRANGVAPAPLPLPLASSNAAAALPPAPKPAAPVAPPRQWAKVQQVQQVAGSDDSLPTPAEAFKAGAAAGPAAAPAAAAAEEGADGFRAAPTAGAKKNRRKA